MKGSRSFNSHVLHHQYMALWEDVWSVPHALLQNRHRTFSPGLWASRGKVDMLPHLLFPFYGAMLSRGYLATPGPLEKVTSFLKCLWESLGPILHQIWVRNSAVCLGGVLAHLGGKPWSSVCLWRKKSKQAFVYLLQNQDHFQKWISLWWVQFTRVCPRVWKQNPI